MTKKSITIQGINEILNNTIESISSSQDELIEIVNYSMEECKRLEEELQQIQIKVNSIILKVEQLERLDRISRNNLLTKNKEFDKYDEESMKKAYTIANQTRVDLLLKMEEEKNYRERRKEVEIRLKSAMDIHEKAGNISSQINVVSEYLLGNVGDITESIDVLSQKHYLGIRIMEAQEEERHRLARDIHDGPAQSMANIILKAELCEKLIEIDKEKSLEELSGLKEIARDTLREIRKTIYDLRPMSLEDLGLIPTLEQYIDVFQEDSKIPIQFKSYGNFNSLEPVFHVSIFRIIQEGLSNIRKHSKANSASIIMESTQKNLNLLIKDDGIGFDLKLCKNDSKPLEGGFGLINIKERVEMLNGAINIVSAINEGTKISIVIPLGEGA